MRSTAVALLLLAAPAQAADPADPLGSPLFADIRAQVLGDAPIVFDPRVVVTVPPAAEDSGAVPVAVRAEGMPAIRTIVLFSDYNPIPKILAFHPTRAEPFVATRIKVAMATPVRAAALTEDGVWHLGGAWVDAGGGGCTAPSVGSANPEWQTRLGEVHARAWSRGEVTRVRFRLLHPMDTGLAGNIPAYFLESTTLSDARGDELARIETFEPVSENPVLTLEVRARAGTDGFALKGRDNNGNEFHATVREGGPRP